MPVSAQYKHTEGVAGDIASLQYQIIEGAIEETFNGLSSTLPFGVALVRGASYRQLVLPTADTQECVGISVRNLRVPISDFNYTEDGNGNLIDVQGYKAGDLVARLVQGDIWVQVEKAIAAGSQAFFRHTAAAAPLDQLGFFTDTTSAEHTALSTGYFKRGSSAAGIALLSVGYRAL